MTWEEYCISQLPLAKRMYQKYMKRTWDFKNPTTLSEKLWWLAIYDSTMLKSFCADKITLHDYSIMKLGEDICVPIIAEYNKPEDIDFNTLPNKFVIKCNHGSGYNIIIKDKHTINKSDIYRKLHTWMNEDYSLKHYCELHYKNIPHKIFIEEYMENKGKTALTDYKVHCFNGNPKFCQVITERFTNALHFNYYDLDFKPMLNVSRNDHPADYSKLDKPPYNWALMLQYAAKLSKDFKYVRVDFYEIDGKIYLGELTFTPNGGNIQYKNKQTDIEFGKWLKV